MQSSGHLRKPTDDRLAASNRRSGRACTKGGPLRMFRRPAPPRAPQAGRRPQPWWASIDPRNVLRRRAEACMSRTLCATLAAAALAAVLLLAFESESASQELRLATDRPLAFVDADGRTVRSSDFPG